MSRVQKYRAWYKPKRVMIEPENLVMINFDTKVLGVYMEMDGKGYHELRLSDFELMQYVGANDDSEEQNELFADDIVRFEYDGEEYTAKVHFEGPGWLLVNDALPDGYVWIGELTDFDRNYCWIPDSSKLGNIYENPELLGEAAKVE